MRFTPDLRFRHDVSFAAAERLNRILDNPRVQADVFRVPVEDDTNDAPAPGPQAARSAVGPRDKA